MQVLESTVSSTSEDFRTNAEAMDAHITTFRDVEQGLLFQSVAPVMEMP